MNADVRWKQRFANFDRALALLDDALKDVAGLSLLEKEGVIQRFEYTFELAWKTLKDFLEEGGLIISPTVPRQVLKDAFAARILPDGQVWIDMLDHRNSLSHKYDSRVFEKAVVEIESRYLPAMKALHAYLEAKLSE
jgi:nucleotidyltransferase substrate binding protein (TIGR01987 family)